MKNYIILLFTLTLILPSCDQASQPESVTDSSTFYFIRHAEKDRSDATNKDPHLIEFGQMRAQKWSEVLQHVSFDVVYSTDYNRTRETAQPTATSNKLEITLYDPDQINGKAFLEQNRGKTALVVGHSNTTPTFVNSVLGSEKYPQINDDNNSNLYVITVSADGKISDILLVVN